MKQNFKILSLGMILIFILTIFTPYSARADGVLTPSLSMDTSKNYIVASAADLNTLRSDIDKGIDYSGKDIELTQDIDISKSQVPLNSFTTTKTFNGIFNGNFHTISGYTDNKSGLFSLIDKDGVVENVKIDANVEINDNSSVISSNNTNNAYGLIANESGGEITRCSATGTITNNNFAIIGGIAGYSIQQSTNTNGKITNCYSNTVFNNQAPTPSEVSPPLLSGICYYAGDTIQYCYFSGNFTGNKLDKSYTQPIRNQGGNANTCLYDKEVLGFYLAGTSKGIKHTSAEMKNKDTYTTLSFDFDKTWKIDSSVNDGYPYLNSKNQDKVSITVPLDIQVTVEDKTYNPNLSVDENLKAKVTNVQIADTTSEIKDLIAKYNVKVDYTVKDSKLPSTMGKVPVTVNFDKLELTYTPNDDYKFVINKVLPITGKFLDDGQPGPTDDKKAEEIKKAKEAEDIIYGNLENILPSQEGYDKFSWTTVPKFSWVGAKANKAGEEGTIQFTSPLWEVYSSARFGYKGMKQGYYDDWFKSVQDGLKKMKEEGIAPLDLKMTEWEKLVLAITATGYDPRDIEAYDLIDIISNNDYLSKSKQYFSLHYAVLALNSYKYAIPKEGNRIDIESLIHMWAEGAKNGAQANPDRATDMSIMGYQPIADYYDANAKPGDKYYDVREAMDAVFDQYSKSQTYQGFFYGGYTDDNPWNNAQVYMTLGMTKHDIFDNKFIKNGNDIFSGALTSTYYDFINKTVKYDISYDPCQLSRGLDSLVRSYERKNSIFDCTDVKDSTVLVNNTIKALPATITSANKKDVDAAQALYDTLSASKKASIKETTKAKLDAAQKALTNPDTTVTTVAAGITSVTSPLKNVTNLILPIVPSGYTISIKSSDKPEVIGTDGKIAPPDKDTTVALVFTVTNTADNSIADTASINVTVAAKDATNIDTTLEISNLTQEKQFNLSNDAKITIQAANKGTEAKKAALIVGIYDNNGFLLSYGASEQNINALSSVKLNVTLKLPSQGNYTVKGFIWDGLEEMTPISYPIEIPVVDK